MRHKSLVLLLLLTLALVNVPPHSVAAKTGALYQATWGGSNYDYAQAVAVDSSGNSYVVGYTWSFTPGTPSIFLLKYSFTGSLLMQRLWTDGADNYAYGVALDKSNNIYVTGWTDHVGGPSMLLLKFNPFGGLVWQKTYSGSGHPAYGQGVAVDSTDSVYVTGYHAGGPSGDQNATLLKFDPAGNLIWQRSWGGSNPDQGKSVALDSAGNVYVAGSTNSFGAGAADAFLLEFNATGGLLSQITWGGSGDDKANGVAVDASGNVYITGSTLSAGLTSDVFLLKFSSAGSLLTKRIYALTGATYGYGVAVNSNTGQIWIAGSTIMGSYSRGLILRLTTAGTLISQTTWGGSGGGDAAYAVANDISGNAMIAGYVSENGPYTFTNATGSISNSNLNTTKPVVQATDPGFSLGFAAGSASVPPGSLAYVAGPDVFLVKFGTLPSITFLTSPPGAGVIIFSGTSYSSGSSDGYVYGNYTANANSSSQYVFTNWTTTGGISVDNPYSSLVRVSVTGPGTLTAGFAVAFANITLNITPGRTGTVTCNGQTYTANATTFQIHMNSTLTCSANSYSGFRFENWGGLFAGTTTSATFKVTSSGTLTAAFAAIPAAPFSPLASLLSGLMAVSILMMRKRRVL